MLHAAGAHVVATARRGELLDQLASKWGSRVGALPGDITDRGHREMVVEHLRSTGLDILINNAGICDDGPLEEHTLDDLLRVVDVNLISVLDMCRLSAPLLLSSDAASVVNIASMYGVVASRGPMAAYNATKGAMVNLTRNLAASGDSAACASMPWPLGYFPTELTGHFSDREFERSIWEKTLLGRTPALDEIDGPLLYLASSASSYMTGQVLVIDGGWTAI